MRDTEVVAPYVGAWIETDRYRVISPNSRSHPTWVRGLKLGVSILLFGVDKSHPTWVRGLKHELRRERDERSRRTLRGCVD